MVRITVSGTPGSGKSTVAKILHEKTGLPYVNAGDIFRELAQEYGMNLEEFGSYCKHHKDVDTKLDQRQLEKLQQQEDILLEGRLTGWLAYKHKIPAVKVFITADTDTRAKRIVKREGGSIEQRKQEILTRQQCEAARYQQYYHVDLKDTSLYDLVIDSSEKPPEEIVEMILSYLSQNTP